MELTTELPLWLGIFSILLGALYSYILYKRDAAFSETKKMILYGMTALRFFSVSIISFLLLSPLIKTVFREVEKPLIVIAQDHSKSIIQGKDSAFYTGNYNESLNKLKEELKENFDVRTYSFGENVRENIDGKYTDRQTDFSGLIEELNVRFSNRNTGAIIIASDGLYNEGNNPVYAAQDIKVPIYTVAMGDTTINKDLLISKINYNKVAYLGNNFPIEIVINAKMLQGKNSELIVSKEDQILSKKAINITNNNFSISLPLYLDANKKGIMHYKIQLTELESEVNKENNVRDIYIEVLENKDKILILADAANPDIAAIRSALEMNQNYEVKTEFSDNFNGTFKEFNLVILHNIPSKRKGSKALMERLQTDKIPIFYILGSNTSLSEFNLTEAGLKIQETLSKSNEVTAAMSNDFSLFTISDETMRETPLFPPVITPFGNYQMQTNPYVLMYQQIGSVKTQQPLLMFTNSGNIKTGIFCGEGLWKWKLFDFSKHDNHVIFNEIITKSVQYLSAREDKGFFRVKSKNHFKENEIVHFDAEVFNKSYELINNGDVNITITDKSNKVYTFLFSKSDKAFVLDAGYLQPGDYKYSAKTKVGDQIYTASGAFSVSKLQLESSETVANHQIMNLLASKHDGKMLYPKEIESLSKIIKERTDIKSISYTQKKLKEVINIKWIFFILLLLLSAEWLIRKRNGAY